MIGSSSATITRRCDQLNSAHSVCTIASSAKTSAKRKQFRRWRSPQPLSRQRSDNRRAVVGTPCAEDVLMNPTPDVPVEKRQLYVHRRSQRLAGTVDQPPNLGNQCAMGIMAWCSYDSFLHYALQFKFRSRMELAGLLHFCSKGTLVYINQSVDLIFLCNLLFLLCKFPQRCLV